MRNLCASPATLVVAVGLFGCDRDTSSSPAPAASLAPAAEAPSVAAVAPFDKKPPRPEADLSKLAKEGAPAPAFEATAHDGSAVSLEKLRGKNVVLYFYPKDDTPGCTIEAKGFRDSHGDLEKADTVVLGVSTDDSASHEAFAKKYELPFLLLPDPEQKIAQKYGVPVRGGYASRVTFVIDKKGQIARVFEKVDPRAHAEEVKTAIQSLG